MNVERWIANVAAESPCGDDLEYDEEFMALGRAVLGKPEQQYGDTVIAAEKPDWREVERLADALMLRTKDIRVGILLTRALTHNQGLSGLATGLGLLQSLMDRYWEHLHPRLLVDGNVDPYIRISAIAELADIPGLIRDVRHAVLIKSAIGPITVKEAEAVLEHGVSDGGLSRQQLLAIGADAHRQSQPALLAVDAARQALMRITSLCQAHFGENETPDLTSLSALLSKLVAIFPSDTPAGDASDVDQASPAGLAGDPSHLQAGKGADLGQITSRQDVLRALDAVCRYIEENEPSNPAPLLIKRAQRLMTLDFMEIMMDLAPDSVTHISLITGVRQH